MPPDMDIWVDTVGKKKMRVFGLGSLSKSLISSSNQSTSANTREVDDLRSQVHALNASLQRQAQEKEQMMQQLQRQDQEMKETNQKLSSLMQHLGFTGSSSHAPQANNEKFTNEDEDDNEKFTNEDEDDNNEFEEDDNNYFEDHYNYNEYEDLS
jgi:septal ring factor EnvC (AmiA/AmiB activator)